MGELRIASISDPSLESAEATRVLLAIVYRAALMDLLPERGDGEIVVDRGWLRGLADAIGRAGIGRAVTLELAGAGEGLAAPLWALWEALDESPYPRGEWRGMRERLGDEQLARLLRISPSSLRRYAGGERETPDEVAWRLHALTRIVAALLGSYNDYGVRRWFERSRAQLGGRSPAEAFVAADGEDDADLRAVVELAEALVGPAVAA